ncbi:ankyrin repeat domain-containing protein [Chitinophaga eiseniae]|uniref:Ankyrin repeat domain-containing protein n=1 Tax=Chitinophaga eiseniae TaxID=634771 RepID=A0A847SEJ2_9BACT|nr:ankyrin repeat domain-containing protein [Chitinophaga eiseniae]NLR77375.1 ankyrin repeat domain-containing protein [Chitinophaga eiseniae]
MLNSYIFDGNLEMVKRHFHTTIVNTPAEEGGMHPIQVAIEGGHPDVVDFLIRIGADVNLEVYAGWTPLHHALDLAIDGMIQCNLDRPTPEIMKIIDLLIQAGADPVKQVSGGETALELLNSYSANQEGFDELLGFFREVVPGIDSKIQFRKGER